MQNTSLSLRALRQCAASVVACAVRDLYPDVILVDGESTDSGFYYDFVFKKPPDEALLPQLEERLRALVTADLPIRTLAMMRQNAAELFKHHKQTIKAHLALHAQNQCVDVFQMGDFYDLCPLPHIASSKEVVALKLQQVIPEVSRFFSGEELLVTRIMGTAFPDKMALKQFLKQAHAAKERDHRLLGEEMDLLSVYPEASLGSAFWHGRGMLLRGVLEDVWKKAHTEQGFQLVSTPKIVKRSFIKQAGWSDRDAWPLAVPVDLEGTEDVLVAHPAPLHALLFASDASSRAYLPARYAECGDVYADIAPSQLYGMFRTRSAYQDHASIFCTSEQVGEELISSLHFIDRMSKMFDLKAKWILRSRLPQKKKRQENAKKALDWLTKAIEASGFEYRLDAASESDLPKIELCLCDALGQEWPVSSLWVETQLPSWIENQPEEPEADEKVEVNLVLVGRSLFGSFERFVSLLLEENTGNFPLWLAPEQLRILPIGKQQMGYAQQILETCLHNGWRARIEPAAPDVSLAAKIERAAREKVPYLLTVGPREEQDMTVSARSLTKKEAQKTLKLEDFLAECEKLLQNGKNSKGSF